MSSSSLSQRLHALSEIYKQTLNLIQELHKFPNGSTPLSVNLDEQRLDLANTCHQNLKEADETLEILRQEIEDDNPSNSSRRHAASVKDLERERQTTAISRLGEDLRSARAAFRRAQLQSKKNLDAVKRREREELFADRTAEHAQPRRKGQEKLTQDELALNAAEDVTKSLRRTHALLSSNLQQSQFAQQTLEESQTQLTTLSDRYSGTTNLLQSSRGLVKQLVTSQKSDTWYLQTTVYILLVTIGWLFFRRVLYGPLWWLVWFPAKWLYWMILSTLGLATAGKGKELISEPISSRLNVPTNPPGQQWAHQPLPPKGGGWGPREFANIPPSPEIVQTVSRMIEESTAVSGEQPDESGEATNTKKRMMELEKEQERPRDEL